MRTSALVLLSLALLACDAAESPAAPPAEAGSATAGAAATVGAAASSGAAAGAEADTTYAPERVMARFGDTTITWKNLEEATRSDVATQRAEYLTNLYETRSRALDAMVIEKLLEAEAKKGGHADVQALLKAEIEDKTPAPSNEEIDAFYPLVERQLQGMPLEQARPLLAQELVNRARSEAYQAYVKSLREAAGVEVDLPYPELPRAEVAVVEHDPTIGPADAPVTIVQFAEYECYYCGKVGPTIDQVLETYGDKVRFVFKDFPLGSHARATPAAVAAHCAGEQGKYWEMNEVLLNNQQQLGDAELVQHAASVGVDTEAFEACQSSGKYEPLVMADMKEGERVGVRATPTFFVNGIQVSGAQPYERFAALIDQELE